MQTLNPALRYVGTICLWCVLMYTVVLRAAEHEFLMSYIKMGGMAANIFISATTGLPEGCTPMTQLPLSHSITTTTLIDSQLVHVLHASPCLQLSITDGLAIVCQGEGSRPHSPLALVDSTCFKPRVPKDR